MLTALVTGASRGIGAAIAEELAAAGCRLITPSHAELDLASAESVEAYLAGQPAEVDILVNNAGINRIASFEEIRSQDLADTLEINLLSPLRLSKFFAVGMKARKFGRILNISSLWSLVARPGRSSYAISKTALNGLTRSMAVELAPHNVLVNALAPGYVLTDLTRQNNSPEEIEAIGKSIPMRRLAEPAEIARVAAFLCSEKNSYMTGQIIVVDGGYTCL